MRGPAMTLQTKQGGAERAENIRTLGHVRRVEKRSLKDIMLTEILETTIQKTLFHDAESAT